MSEAELRVNMRILEHVHHRLNDLFNSRDLVNGDKEANGAAFLAVVEALPAELTALFGQEARATFRRVVPVRWEASVDSWMRSLGHPAKGEALN